MRAVKSGLTACHINTYRAGFTSPSARMLAHPPQLSMQNLPVRKVVPTAYRQCNCRSPKKCRPLHVHFCLDGTSLLANGDLKKVLGNGEGTMFFLGHKVKKLQTKSLRWTSISDSPFPCGPSLQNPTLHSSLLIRNRIVITS